MKTEKSGKIKLPILVPFVATIAMALTVFIIGLYWLQNEHINRNVHKMIHGTQALFDEHLRKDAVMMNGLIDFIKKDETIQQAWLAKDRQVLLNYAIPLFEEIRSKYNVTYFYLHGTDRICFLRMHNPPKHGDYIKRFTMDEVVQQEKPVYGIELGKFGTFTLRVIHPWYIEGELVGYLELGEEIEHITTSLKKTLVADMCFIIHKSFLNRADWEEGLKMVGKSGNWDLMSDYVIIDSTLEKIPPELFKALTSVHGEHKSMLLDSKIADREYRCGFFSLIDAGKRDVGDIVVMKDTTQSKTSVRQLTTILTAVCFFIGIGLVVFLNFYIGVIEKKLQKYNGYLEDAVEERTIELKTVNEKLEQKITEHNQTQKELILARARLEKQIADLEESKEASLNMMEDLAIKGSEYKKTEEEINILKHQIEFILGVTKTGLDIIDSEFNIRYIDPEWQKVYGDPTGKKCYEYFMGRNDICPACGVTKALETKAIAVTEEILVKENNRPVQVTTIPFQNDQGEWLVAEVNADITERKQTEKTLENLNDELTATIAKLTTANQQLADFAHAAAHDLKTPLRAIGTIADWIATDYADKFDEEGRKKVRLLVGRAERMGKLIDSILLYSETGHTVQTGEKINLNILLAEVITKINPPENIEITVENELPTLIREKTSIVQIFQNLLSNAVQYIDKPYGRIRVSCIEENGFWKFSIADNGSGIEAEYHEKIFKMFQTLLPWDKCESVGIGLAIVKKNVEVYEGSIWVESKPGQGSTFYFTLPKQESEIIENAQLEANIIS